MQELIEVATSQDYLWNGAVCEPSGRLFAGFPGWLGPTAGVIEILPDGSKKPFPGNSWNEWAPGKNPKQHLIDVNSVIPDGKGSLWVLDAAAPGFGTSTEGGKAIPGAVKIVQFSLATGESQRVIYFDEKDAHPETRLAHMRFHGDHAFVAESKEGSFYVIDLRDNSYRRILVGHPLMRCEPDDVPTIEGRKIHLPNGKPMYIHNDLIEFGKDPDILFFMCLFGSKMYQVHVGVLKDPNLSDAEIASRVSVAREFGPWITGICRDVDGNIYLSDAENGAIRVLRTDGTLEEVVRDPRMIWPNTPSVGPDGYIYFTSTQLNRVPRFSGGKDLVQKPWKMFKAKVR